ncbi:hypothetical protein FQR65_LT09218 [Abscondita terminalis]|nr:hypothetical protein FQR65_LT09218 [Abscondita terminalis]
MFILYVTLLLYLQIKSTLGSLDPANYDLPSCINNIIHYVYKWDNTIYFVSENDTNEFVSSSLINPFVTVNINKPITTPLRYGTNWIMHAEDLDSVRRMLRTLSKSQIWSNPESTAGRFILITTSDEHVKLFKNCWMYNITNLVVVNSNSLLLHTCNPFERDNKCGKLVNKYTVQKCGKYLIFNFKEYLQQIGECPSRKEMIKIDVPKQETIKSFLCYFIAVLYKHVYPVLPYISDTGATPPESCIFGQMLNIGAILLALIMYVRYRQVDFILKSNDIGISKRWNGFSLLVGYFICFGITIVGNFQQNTVLYIHLIGAMTTFGGTAVLFLVQTRMSFALRPFYEKYPTYAVGEYVLYYRLILTGLYIIFFVALCLFSFVSVNEFTGNDYRWWTEEHGGYLWHLLSTSSEWFLVITLVLYVLSVSKEFQSLQFQEIKFIDKNADVDNGECRL